MMAGKGLFEIGKVVYSRWGDIKIREIVSSKKVIGRREGEETDYSYIIRSIEVGDQVGTRWGQAEVVKVHGDGDIECKWDGYDGVFTVGLEEVYRKNRTKNVVEGRGAVREEGHRRGEGERRRGRR